jgi:hypothetical protein
VLPRGLRTRSLHARLPLYQVAMLGYLASLKQTSVSHLIAQQLDDVAGEHLQQLASVIPEFREAFDWPEVDLQPPAC